MKAQITKLNLNCRRKLGQREFDGAELTYQPEPYKGEVKDPVDKFIFNNSDVIKDVQRLNIGDWVEIEFEKNVKNGRTYYNPCKFTIIDEPVAQGPAPKKNYGGGGKKFDDDPETQARIARSVAIKEAAAVTIARIEAGAYSAANLKKPEFVTLETLEVAKQFAAFVNGDLEDADVEDEDLPWDEVDQDDING